VSLRILVTGGTGLIGREVCRRLVAEGNLVTLLSRRPSTELSLESFLWDAQAGPPPVQAIEQCDAIINLAGEPVIAPRWTQDAKARIRKSRVVGTRNLVSAIASATARPKVLVNASAVGFYGDRGDEILTEESSRGTGFLGEVSAEWEEEANTARELGLRVCTIRVGLVLSSSGGALPMMLPAFRLGLAAAFGDGKQWFPWIHVDDVVGIILHALRTESVSGPLNAASPGIVRNREFVNALAGQLRRPAFLRAPSFALKLLLGEMAELVLGSQRVVPARTLESGYNFLFPHLEEALKNLVH
jgi:uncharacterized protein